MLTSRHLLLLGYAAVWPVSAAKWVALWFVFQRFGLGIAIGCTALGYVAITCTPIPYRHFRSIFERRVEHLLGEQPAVAARLTLALLREK